MGIVKSIKKCFNGEPCAFPEYSICAACPYFKAAKPELFSH